jgi:hypothetical protein
MTNLATFRRKALRNELEVEHILRAAKTRTEGLAELLRNLVTECSWTDGRKFADGSMEVPFRKWAVVGATYCESGCSGLVALVRQEASYLTFVLAMLEEVKNDEAVASVLTLTGVLLDDPGRDLKASRAIAESFNSLLFIRSSLMVSANDARRIRLFLHALIGSKADDTARAMAIYALRPVGDETSVALLQGLKSLEYPWTDAPGIAIREIKKKMRSQAA